MDLIEGIGIGIDTVNELYPSQEPLHIRPSDPRAWHCQTVEEYRLFRFSTSYGGELGDGNTFDMRDSFSVDFSDLLD